MLFYSHRPAVLSSVHGAEEAFTCDCCSGSLFCSFGQPHFWARGTVEEVTAGFKCTEQDVAAEERVRKAAGPGVEALV